MIRFNLNEQKAIEALVWLANEKPGISFYYVVKVLFFADKIHLNKYGRPILGDQYIAMPHGPVPSVVYDLLKRDGFLDPHLVQQVNDSVAIREANPPTIDPHDGRRPNLEVFSKSDIECLKESLRIYGAMSFGTLKDVTHREPAYVGAATNGPMDYLEMVDSDNPRRKEIVRHLKEFAEHLSL